MAEKDGTLKRIALVNFKEPQAAQDAIKDLDGKKLEDGTVMFLSKHLNKRELEHQTKIPTSFVSQNNRKLNASNLFMRRLRPDITEEEIRAEFSKAGEVLEIKLMDKDIIDNDTKQKIGTKRQGYVRMADQKAAQLAIQKFDGEDYFGRGFSVDFW